MAPLSGPGYATPMEAMTKGSREELLYVICIQPNQTETKTDFLATVDVNPKSPTYCQIIHYLRTGNKDDELHHSGWNVCSSCHGCTAAVRDKLVMPALGSDRVYLVDVGKNPKAPSIYKVFESSEMHALNCATPHTTHCLANGDIMISTMGDAEGNEKGDFILIDSKTLKMKGTWTKGQTAKFGYDFWYQPHFNIMIATEWATPKVFKKGFAPSQAADPNVYGRSLNFYSWNEQKLIQSVNLGDDGIAPLEVRFLHDPLQPQGFVGCALNANVYRFYLKDNKWNVDKVVNIKPKKVTGWVTDYIQGMITDIILSLDDKYLYLSNWFHGDVRQYDISDPAHPKLTGQIFLGGQILKDSKIKVIEDQELTEQPSPVYVKGRRLYGAPQMLQLSLDGKRLYVTSSLFAPWDKQFYPDSIKHGSFLLKLDIDHENGGMKLDPDFFVDFENTEDGPVLAHEVRYPGGDCSSDIWLADTTCKK